MNSFPKNLHAWRIGRGKKLIETARAFGVAPATWDHWENGRRFPSGQNLLLLAKYTALPLQCLVCDHYGHCGRRPPQKYTQDR